MLRILTGGLMIMSVTANDRKAIANATASARARIAALLDEGSFLEVGTFVARRPTEFDLTSPGAPAEGVVTGWGTVDGAPVCVFAQDAAALGGAMSEMQAKKITILYEYALKTGVPIVGIFDSKGVRLAEGVDALNGYASVIASARAASGVVPQIAIIAGGCGGAAALFASQFDFRIALDKGEVFMHSPTVLSATLKKPEQSAAGKAAVERGLADFAAASEEEAAEIAKTLLSYLPSNNAGDKNYAVTTDDLNRQIDVSATDNGKPEAVLAQIADNGAYFAVAPDYAPAVFTAFARFDGESVGVLGAYDVLDRKACEKAAQFVDFCDAFGISLLTIVNASGFAVAEDFENNGGVAAAAALAASYADAGIATVTLITGKAVGSAYVALGAKGLGSDLVFAWPSAEIGALSAEAAVSLFASDAFKDAPNPLEARERLVAEYAAKVASPLETAKRGYVDEIIEPAATRQVVTYALGLLSTKIPINN
jgi:acetyl-CoA carboxylase carboxyltransferase component